MNRLRLLIPLVALIGFGCRQAPGQTAATSTAAIEPSPSPRATLSNTTPQPTPIPTATPPLPTPDFLAAPVDVRSLLASASDECRLPCWQGLRNGESTGTDVQRVFDDILGFNGTLDIVHDGQVTDDFKIYSDIGILSSNLLVVGHEWYINQEGPGGLASIYTFYFAITMVIDKTDNLLRGMRFDRVPGTVYSQNFDPQIIDPGYFQTQVPQQIVKSYGPPDWIFSNGSTGITLIYKPGFISSYILPIHVEERTITGTSDVYSFCLDEQPIIVSDYLIGPFDSLNTTDDLDPQNVWLKSIIEHRFYGPIEDKLGLSAEDFTALALQTDQRPCIVIPNQ